MPILSVPQIPPPPGWDHLPPAVRAEYVATLAAAGIRVTWPTT
jgi:hypothetical protein